MPDSQVDWYADDVKLVVDEATDEFLAEIAFQVEAHAKTNVVANDQVDTGFMLNAIYAVTPKGSGRAQAAGAARAKADRPLAPEPNVERGSSAVHVAAEYAIHQETRKSFVYRALEQTRSEAGGIIESAGKEHLG